MPRVTKVLRDDRHNSRTRLDRKKRGRIRRKKNGMKKKREIKSVRPRKKLV